GTLVRVQPQEPDCGVEDDFASPCGGRPVLPASTGPRAIVPLRVDPHARRISSPVGGEVASAGCNPCGWVTRRAPPAAERERDECEDRQESLKSPLHFATLLAIFVNSNQL